MLHHSTEQTGVHTEEVDLDPGEPVLITVELIKEEGESGGGGAIEVCFKEVEGGAAVRSALKYGLLVKLIITTALVSQSPTFFLQTSRVFWSRQPHLYAAGKGDTGGTRAGHELLWIRQGRCCKKNISKKLFNESSRSGFSHSVAVGEGVHWACPEGQKFSHNVFIRYSCTIFLYMQYAVCNINYAKLIKLRNFIAGQNLNLSAAQR